MAIRISEKSFDNFKDNLIDMLDYFFCGLARFVQFLFPALVAYGVFLFFDDFPLFGFLSFVVGIVGSISIFVHMNEEGFDTVFREINDRFHLFGWK